MRAPDYDTALSKARLLSLDVPYGGLQRMRLSFQPAALDAPPERLYGKHGEGPPIAFHLVRWRPTFDGVEAEYVEDATPTS